STESVKKVPLSTNGLLFWLGLDWSPRGDLLVLTSVDERNRGTIWTVRSDGSRQQKLYESEKPLLSPKWSFDGTSVYFLRSSEWIVVSFDDPSVSSELWKIPVSPLSGVAMREPSVVMSGLQAGESFSMARDAGRLAIGSVVAQSNLWLVERTETGVLRNSQLTQGTALNRAPSISPDANQIAFVRGDNRISNIFTMP